MNEFDVLVYVPRWAWMAALMGLSCLCLLHMAPWFQRWERARQRRRGEDGGD